MYYLFDIVSTWISSCLCFVRAAGDFKKVDLTEENSVKAIMTEIQVEIARFLCLQYF